MMMEATFPPPVRRPPAGFDLDAEAAAVHLRAGKGPYDVGVLFCPDRARLAHR